MKLKEFDRYFELIEALTPDAVDIAQQLRFQVYCVEQGHKLKDTGSLEKEIDEYDPYSVCAYLRYKPNRQPMATVRLIFADQTRLPMERFAMLRRSERDRVWRIPRRRLAEISRFAVSKQFRRRVGEAEVVHGITPQSLNLGGDRRWYPYITIGLFKAIVQMSEKHGITHWYALMESSLIRLLKRFGVQFIPVGPPVNHYGERYPCIGVMEQVLEGIHTYAPEVYDFIKETEVGETQPSRLQQV